MMIVAGQTQNFIISYDNSLANGATLAQAVLDYCEYDLVRLSMLFGNILPPPASLPIQINIVSGGGGGWNNGVNLITCTVNANYTPQGVVALVVAEAAEIFMNIQNHGWIAAWSNGEALSRVSVGWLYPERAFLFSTGSAWLNSTNPARPDWVDSTEHTDQNPISTGCGTLFLNYLAYQRNVRWPAIIGAGAPTTQTLNETATALGVSNAFNDFSTLLANHFPIGTPVSLPNDDPFPLGTISDQVPILYIRHNLADDGTSHAPPLSNSPDIILKNNPVANPQATFSTPASIASATESDPTVVPGQANHVYLRVWNRGSDAPNVFATVYWSPPATLVAPNLWNLIGSAYLPDVPAGQMVQVSNPGVLWPADLLPGPGHYCFVATVGNADDPPPSPSSFNSFNDFVSYIAAHNNIAWHNFDVVAAHRKKPRFGEFVDLPFHITGAWDETHTFVLESLADLPEGSRMELQVAEWIGRALRPGERGLKQYGGVGSDPRNARQVRLPLKAQGSQVIGQIRLAPKTAALSYLLVQIPVASHDRPYEVAIRQLYEGQEVGRITWRIVPKP
jgi:hypothetical protein